MKKVLLISTAVHSTTAAFVGTKGYHCPITVTHFSCLVTHRAVIENVLYFEYAKISISIQISMIKQRLSNYCAA